jgi:hypothetical protein
MDTRHDECGGVSNGVFVSYLATRSDEAERDWSTKMPAVKNNLRQAIDPTSGGRKAAIDLSGDLNTAGGLVDWGRRFEQMTVPTVYSKLHWAKRRLGVKEMGNVLDWLGDLVRLLSQQQLQELSELTVPGKIMSVMLRATERTTPGRNKGVIRKRREEPTDDGEQKKMHLKELVPTGQEDVGSKSGDHDDDSISTELPKLVPRKTKGYSDSEGNQSRRCTCPNSLVAQSDIGSVPTFGNKERRSRESSGRN